MRYASGSGFDTWGLVGSLASLALGVLVRLFIQVHRNRMQKKGRTPMDGSRKKKCNSRKQKIRQYAVEAVGAAGAEVFGDQLAS